jgi:hypothetical protein
MKSLFAFSLILLPFLSMAQQDNLPGNPLPVYLSTKTETVYKKPKPFSFLTNIPGDVLGFSKQSFKKNNLRNLGYIAGSTVLLLLADQSVNNTVQDVAEDHNIRASENFSPLIQIKLGGKKTNIGKVPKNINTAFYDIGQGSSVMLMAAGFFVLGEIKKDNRALQTASQLTEAFISLGLGTQLMKYATGRENPSYATTRGGKWHPFPKWSDFQNDKTRYDAFPSGHLATFVSAVTIISQNYPEKKWIAPVGYSIAGLLSLAMINNGVHWASDFPLGFALGYGFGRFISRKSHFQLVP